MVKKRISVEGCRSGPEGIVVNVVAWDTQKVEDQDQELPLGEKTLSFPAGTTPADMMADIRAAGEEIEAAADTAKEIRAELNELLRKKVPK